METPRGEIAIRFENDQIVGLVCRAIACRFNFPKGSCNLKHIAINIDGKCLDFDLNTKDYTKVNNG